MGKLCGVVPAQLLGNEILYAALLQELGQLPGKAEGIGHPGDRAGLPKLFLNIALPVENLSSDRFAADQV